MRLFVALEIPSAVRDNLATLLDELRRADAGIAKSNARWVRLANLHVTLKFIGHIDDARLDLIREALAVVHSENPIDLRFHGLGFFPNDRRPRILWTGVQSSSNLAALASSIDKHLENLGIPRETRDFAPHLTLARFDPPRLSETLGTAVLKNAGRDFGSLCTGEFHLVESKTRAGGVEYTCLSTFPFAKAGA